MVDPTVPDSLADEVTPVSPPMAASVDLPAQPSFAPPPIPDGAHCVIHRTPRLPGSGPDEVKVRVMREADGRIIVHITSPDPVAAECAMQTLFPAGVPFHTEYCG